MFIPTMCSAKICVRLKQDCVENDGFVQCQFLHIQPVAGNVMQWKRAALFCDSANSCMAWPPEILHTGTSCNSGKLPATRRNGPFAFDMQLVSGNLTSEEVLRTFQRSQSNRCMTCPDRQEMTSFEAPVLCCKTTCCPWTLVKLRLI